MQQVWIPRRGGPEVLEVRAAPDPACGVGEVLVDVAAAGINFADIMARMGLYPDAPPLPCVVGYEVAGVVRAAICRSIHRRYIGTGKAPVRKASLPSRRAAGAPVMPRLCASA